MKRLKWVLIFLFCPLVVFGGDVKTLSLEEAIQMALANNRTLKVAQNRVQISQVGVKDARSAFLPHLTAGASYTRLDEAPYIDASQFGQMFEPLMAPFADLVMQGYLNPSTLAGLQNIGIDRIYMGKEDNYTINVSLEQPLFTGGTILNAYRIARLSSEVEEWN
ncbi:TolC family protein, partial [bacterium]|nr:TolC family protein [bacterium]